MNLDRRDSHEDIEHDAFMTSIVRGWDFLGRNRNVVIGSIVGAVLLVLLAAFFVRNNRLKDERANVILGRATAFIDAEQPDAARPLLEKVRDEFGGTNAALDARFFLGMSALAADQVAEAKAELTAFLDKRHSADFMHTAAQAGLAVCAEREKNWEEAAKTWTKAALLDEKGNFNAPTYLLNAALCWEQAGKPAEALPLLDRILEKYPTSAVKSRVEVIQARLKLI